MAKQTEAEKQAEMKQLAAHLIENRPSVMRTGSIILVLRIASSAISICLYVAAVLVLIQGEKGSLLEFFNAAVHAEITYVMLALVALLTGLFFNLMTWLCRLVRDRNWYILESFEVMEWVEGYGKKM